MIDDSKAVPAIVVGAVIGGFAGYLFFTNRGRALRRSIEPTLDDLAHELSSFRTTLQKAAVTANEGWSLLNDAFGESSRSGARHASPHQSSPF